MNKILTIFFTLYAIFLGLKAFGVEPISSISWWICLVPLMLVLVVLAVIGVALLLFLDGLKV
tara:strand:+ start:1699 stop:1884 length:186 start_codon:yes stop_codon:yes gene_type:complete